MPPSVPFLRIPLLCLSLLVLVVLSACKPQSPNASAPANRGAGAIPPVDVMAKPAQRIDWADRIDAIGTLSANESTAITAKVTETVARINFKDGDEVSAGDVLVELTGKAEVASLREAQAAYREAERQYQRLDAVAARGTVTRAQVEQQAANRDQASARRDAIRARLSDRVIVAPFSGVLGFRQVSPGALVSPGTLITTLDDVRTLKLDFSVAELQLANIKVGDVISAKSAAYVGEEFGGQIESIDSRIDPVTRSILVRAKIANADRRLRPGMLMHVEIQSAPRSALVVDEIAVLQNGKQAYLFIASQDGKTRRVDVELGSRKAGYVEIKSGIAEGELVIGEGNLKLKDGASVKLIAAAP